jgi:protein gp37
VSTQSSIEWTDATWNPVRGCSKVSAGCASCYAMRQAHRFSGSGKPYEGLTHVVPGKGPQWTGAVRTVPQLLDEPLHWRKPRRIFVNSMSDLFHPDVPDEFVHAVFAIMAVTPHHTYQVLTKRPERMSELLGQAGIAGAIAAETGPGCDYPGRRPFIRPDDMPWPLPNVWLGTSVEDQAAADERIPHLLRTPAAVRFLSCEPLLGPLGLEYYIGLDGTNHGSDFFEKHGWGYDDWSGGFIGPTMHNDPTYAPEPGLHWMIAGGESGPGARPCNVEWIRSLISQARAAEVPIFVKQLGAIPATSYYDDAQRQEHEANGWEWPEPIGWDIDRDGQPPLSALVHIELLDRKGGDPSEWPEDLRVREFPATAEAL